MEKLIFELSTVHRKPQKVRRALCSISCPLLTSQKVKTTIPIPFDLLLTFDFEKLEKSPAAVGDAILALEKCNHFVLLLIIIHYSAELAMTRLESFFLLSSLVLLCQGAIKVRYTKAGDTQAGVYSFLSLLGPVQPKEVQFPDPSPFTTPPTSTTSTTTPTPQLKLVDYCLQPRGQFRYEPDCHKFVNCWDGQVYPK